MVGRGFAGAVRAVGLVGIRFCKRRGVFGEGAVNLVGADVQETEGGFVGLGQGGPVGAHGFEQAEGAQDVGLDEVLGAVDGSVHVALGREVDHGPRAVLIQHAIHQGAIAEVALHEDMTQVALQAGEVFQVASVGKFVDIDDRFIGQDAPIDHKVGADEAGVACD